MLSLHSYLELSDWSFNFRRATVGTGSNSMQMCQSTGLSMNYTKMIKEPVGS